jgi:hypothetical protein
MRLEGTLSVFLFYGELARMCEAGERKIFGFLPFFERLLYSV